MSEPLITMMFQVSVIEKLCSSFRTMVIKVQTVVENVTPCPVFDCYVGKGVCFCRKNLPDNEKIILDIMDFEAFRICHLRQKLPRRGYPYQPTATP